MYPLVKRGLDVLVALVGLILLGPVLVAIGARIGSTMGRPVLFVQTRVGRRGRPFQLLKFRTMSAASVGNANLDVTAGGDPRITPLGRKLRRRKLDELPQLLNVLRGEMSLVGPRPELPRYVEAYPDEYEKLLSLRPGLTDYAALEYRDEEGLLAASADPEQTYVHDILPAKLRLSTKYMERQSLWVDLSLIGRTIWLLRH